MKGKLGHYRYGKFLSVPANEKFYTACILDRYARCKNVTELKIRFKCLLFL